MSQAFQTIGLIAKRKEARVTQTLQQLIELLHSRRHRILLDATAAEHLPETERPTLEREALCREADLLIAVGGDGTLLDAARSLGENETPLLGINLGRLGFLVDVSPDEMTDRLNAILDGDHVAEERFVLTADVIRHDEVIYRQRAFNDIVYHVRAVVRMVEFETYINDHYLNTQRADGIVISTPSGSTAYALSAGGPIIEPSLQAIVLAPICPHTLSNRPIVVDTDSVIDIVPKSGSCFGQVSFDGQANYDILENDRVRIRRHPTPVRLLHPSDHDYFHILRAKLRWAEQP